MDCFEFQGLLSDEFQGEKCIFLTSAHDGMISRDFFSQCVVTFKTSFFNGGFGFIYKAENLENYLMLKFNIDNNILNVKPHIRKGRLWDVHDKINSAEIIEGEIYEVKIIINGRIINYEIVQERDFKKIFEDSYIVPDYFPYTAKLVEAGNGIGDIEKLAGASRKIEPPVFGKIGFRAWQFEKAVIYNLKVEKK